MRWLDAALRWDWIWEVIVISLLYLIIQVHHYRRRLLDLRKSVIIKKTIIHELFMRQPTPGVLLLMMHHVWSPWLYLDLQLAIYDRIWNFLLVVAILQHAMIEIVVEVMNERRNVPIISQIWILRETSRLPGVGCRYMLIWVVEGILIPLYSWSTVWRHCWKPVISNIVFWFLLSPDFDWFHNIFLFRWFFCATHICFSDLRALSIYDFCLNLFVVKKLIAEGEIHLWCWCFCLRSYISILFCYQFLFFKELAYLDNLVFAIWVYGRRLLGTFEVWDVAESALFLLTGEGFRVLRIHLVQLAAFKIGVSTMQLLYWRFVFSIHAC